MKTNFLGSRGRTRSTVTQELGPSARASRRSTRRREQVERCSARSRASRPCRCRSARAARRCATRFSAAAAAASRTRSPPTETPTRSPCRPRSQASVDDLDDVGDDHRWRRRAASAPRATSRSTSPRPNAEDLQDGDRRRAVEAARRARRRRARSRATCPASRRYIAVEVDRDDAAAARALRGRRRRLVSNAMQPQSVGSVEIDETTLTVYLAASDPPATVEELPALEVPTPTGVDAARRRSPPSRRSRARRRSRPSSGLRSATVTATPIDRRPRHGQRRRSRPRSTTVDLPAGATASIGGVSRRAGRTRSRSSGSRCSRRS